MDTYCTLSLIRFPPLFGQVIIQGLRESGIFDSVTASASETHAKEKFLSSITTSNSSKAVASQSLPSRRVGTSKKYQATARKALQIEAEEWHASAVPPQSPPGIDYETRNLVGGT